jgi:hypothetical protein
MVSAIQNIQTDSQMALFLAIMKLFQRPDRDTPWLDLLVEVPVLEVVALR